MAYFEAPTVSPASTPHELREMIRNNQWKQTTAGLASGYVQANLVMLPRDLAFDFLLFCHRNPAPCPVLEVIEPGTVEPKQFAPGADLRTDLPLYNVYEHGALTATVENVSDYWRDDLVSFLLGCSFSFQEALIDSGIPVRHVEEGKSDPTFVTTIETSRAGKFSGPMVVSMWPIHWSQVSRVIQITSRLPGAHGAPIHIGDPTALGIKDLYNPEYGDTVIPRKDEVPVFWGCGVTPQVVALQSKPPLMITHSAGRMLITDVKYNEIAVL